MSSLHLAISHSRDDVSRIVADCVRAAELREAYVEMICTRGIPAPGSRDPRSCSNRFFAFAIPFIWIATPEQRERGLHLTISGIERIAPRAVDPRVKNFHWLDLVRALYQAYDQGGDTAVVVDADGNVVEGPGFNLFVVKDGALATPAVGVLEGITRKTVIDLAHGCNYAVRLGSIPAGEVRAADEVFITSTAGGIMPVTVVDGQPVSAGVPGVITRKLGRDYWSLHDDPEYTTEV